MFSIRLLARAAVSCDQFFSAVQPSANGRAIRAACLSLILACAALAPSVALADPSVTSSPSDAAVIAGDTASFTASATGQDSVQWQVSTDGGSHWSDVSGATSDTLNFTPTLSQTKSQYRAEYTGAGVTADSGAATLTVKPLPPTGTASLSATTVASGGAFTLTITLTNPNDARIIYAYMGDATTPNQFYTLPSGVTATAPGSSDCNFSGLSGDVGGYGGPLAAGATCTIVYQMSVTGTGVHTFRDFGAGSLTTDGFVPGGDIASPGAVTVAGPTPSITGLSAATGSSAGGATLTITGVNFDATPANDAVKIGGVAATVTAASATSITVTTPAGTVGAQDVTVTVGGQTATDTGAYTYVATPTVTRVFAGVAGGATEVDGSNFDPTPGNNVVRFGGVAATVTGGGTTYLQVTIPAGAPSSTVDVTVTNAGGTSAVSSADSFHYTAPMTATVAFQSTTVNAGSPAYLVVTLTNPDSVTQTFYQNALPFISGFGFGGIVTTPASGQFAGQYQVGSSIGLGGGPVAANGSLVFTIKFTAPANATPGVYSITVPSFTASNGYNFGGGSASVTVSVPTPTITNVSPAKGPVAGGTSIVLSGTNFSATAANDAVTIGGAPATVTAAGTTSLTVTAPSGTAGAQDVAVTVGSLTGTATGGYTYVAAPTVTGVYPGIAGGTSYISGSNFDPTPGNNVVSFGGVAATVTGASTTSLTVTIPAGTTGSTVDVTVTTAGGTSAVGTSDRFHYPVPLTTTVAFSATTAVAGGTINLVVTISNPDTAAQTAYSVSFPHIPYFIVYTNPTVTPYGAWNYSVSDTTISLGNVAVPAGGTVSFSLPYRLPANASGSYSTTVPAFQSQSGYTFGGGTASFTAVAATPTVTGLSASTGPTAGGGSLTITGTNFDTTPANDTVKFGTTTATVTAASATLLTVTIPAGSAGQVDVTLTTGNGTSAISNADHYTYVAAPTLSSLTTRVGLTDGSTPNVLYGHNFTGATSVTIGGAAVTSFNVVDDGTIDLTPAAHAATTTDLDLVVTTSGGSATLTQAYGYVAQPTVTGISPSSGSSTGSAFTTTITGTNFVSGAMHVYFGGAPASAISVTNSTTMLVSPPAGSGAVAVTVDDRGIASTGTLTYTYVAAPTLTAASASVAYGSSNDIIAAGTLTSPTGSPTAWTVSATSGGTYGSSAVSTHGALSISGSTVTYTPTAGFRGADTFYVKAANDGGTSPDVAITVTVGDPSFTANIAAVATVGVPYNGGGAVVTMSGGTGPYSAFSATGLPNGLSISPAGIISGTPTTKGVFSAVSITATDSSTPAFTGAASSSITVSQGAQTVSFSSTAPTTATPGGATYGVSGTASSGLTPVITIDASSSSVCSISGGTVSFAASGACVIDLNQAGDGDYAAATQVQQTITVGLPATTTTVASNVASPVAQQSIHFTFTVAGAGPTGQLKVKLDGALYGTPTLSSGAAAFNIQLAAGAHTIEADYPGDGANAASVGTLAITAAQAASTVGGNARGPTNPITVGDAVKFAVQAFAVSPSGGTPTGTVQVLDGSSVLATIPLNVNASDGPGGGDVTLSTLAAGNHSISFVYSGDANYTASTSSTSNLGINAATPTITSLSPATGPATGGQSVVISGSNFDATPANDTVTFGTAAATVTAASTTSLTVTTPAGTAGAGVAVSVTTAGSQMGSLAGAYTYAGAPTITGVSPSGGPLTAGTSVTITGTNLGGVTSVTIGGNAATVTASSATSITVTVPAGSAGASDVVVNTGGGSVTSAGGFTYAAVPTLSDTAASAAYDAPTAITVGTLTAPTGSPTSWTVSSSANGTFGASASTAHAFIVVNGASVTYGVATGFHGADTFYVKAVNAGGTSSAAKISVTVANPSFTITLPTPAPQVGIAYNPGGASVTMAGGLIPYSAFSASGLPAGLTISTSGVISGTPTAAGTVNPLSITATDSGVPTFTGTAQTTLTVAKGAQTVSFTSTAPASAMVGGTTYAVTGTASSGLTPTITADAASAGICTVTSNTVAFIGAGACVIDLNQAGSADYNAAAQMQQTIPVTASLPSTTTTVSSSVTTPAVGQSVDLTFKVTGPAPSGLIQVKIDGAAYGSGYLSAGSFALNLTFNAGSHTIEADYAGNNQNVASVGTLSFVVPQASTTTTASWTASVTPTTASDTLIFTARVAAVSPASGSPTGSVQVLDGTTVVATISPLNFVGAGIVGGEAAPISLPQGNHLISFVYSGDANYTTSTKAATALTIVGGMPTLTSVSPNSGPAAGGQSVTITGSGFDTITLANNVVTFGGGTAATVTAATATSLTVTTTIGTAGATVDVAVYVDGGRPGVLSSGYTYAAGPSVTATNPRFGPTAGGTAVTLTGTLLSGVTAVTVGGTAATNVSATATSVSFTTPAGTAGPSTVVLLSSGSAILTQPGGFFYAAPPTIGGISPGSAPSAGGTSIVISGTNLISSTVTIGGRAATVTADTPTSITVTTPAGSGPADVVVTTPGGSVTSVGGFTYAGSPTITGISPSGGPQTAGTSVTITGTNLGGVTSVTIGGVSATVTASSGTSITVTVPAGGAGPADVVVTTPGGAVTSTGGFTYAAAPTVSGVSPAAGPLAGGTSVVVTGTHFDLTPANDKVKFGGLAGTVTAATATSLTVTSPAGSAGAVDVTVTTQGGASATVLADRFVYTAAPIAGAVTANVAYNSTADPITLVVSGGAPVSVTASTPAHGAASVSGLAISYTPTGGYYGADSFTYTATNAGGTSTAATVSLTVGNPPAPTAGAASLTVGYNTADGVDLTSKLGGVLTILSQGTAPAHGAVVFTGDTATYTPTSGYYGADSFTYVANGPGGASAPATVSVTVGNPPAPVATAKQVTVTTAAPTPGTPPSASTIDLSASVSYAASIIITVPPVHGTAVVSGFSVLYTPNAGYFGTDSFTYEAVGLTGHMQARPRSSDAPPSSGSNSAVVSINIPSPTLALTPNTLPSGKAGAAYSQTFVASNGTAPYTYAVSTGALPTGLTLNPTSGVLSGTPTERGSFAVTVKATDSSTGVGPFTVSQAFNLTIAAPTITVTPTALMAGSVGAAYPPVSFAGSGGVGAYSYALTLGALPAGMNLSPSGVLSGTPTASGPFSFTVTATDMTTGAGGAGTGSVAVSLTIASTAAPIAAAKTAATPANAPLQIALTTGDTGVISGVTIGAAPTHGTVTLSGTTATYTPATNYFGPDSFTYTDRGPGGTSNAATVNLTVTPLAAPTATAETANVLAGKSVTVHLAAGASGSPTSATLLTPPQVGSATLTGTDVLYTAPNGFSGRTSFTFTLSNPFGTSSVATATVTVNPLPMVAAPITMQLAADKSGQADVTTGATGGPFTSAAILSVTPSTAGVAQLVQTSGTVGVNATFAVKFTPARHVSGAAVVSYTLSNAYAPSDPGTVTFQVAARPDPTHDAGVRGLISAQIGAALRFAEAQISNFNQRLESLHSRGPARSVNGLALRVGDGPEQPGPDQSPARDDRAFMPKYFGANDKLDPAGAATLSNSPSGASAGPASGAGSVFGASLTGGSRTALVGSAARSFTGGGNLGAAATGVAGDGKALQAANGDAKADPQAERLAFWTGGSIDFGLHHQGPVRTGLKFSTAGISGGVDYRLSDKLILGAGVGYGEDKTNVGSDGTQEKSDSLVAVTYGSFHPSQKSFVDGLIGYGRIHYDNRRFDAAASETEFGTRKGDELFGSLTASWEFRGERTLLSPYARVDGVAGKLDPFTETGGVGALTFAQETVRSLKSTLGLHGDYLVVTRQGEWQPRFRVEYAHEFQRSGDLSLQYADWLNGPVYRSGIDGTGRDHLVLGVGTDFRNKDLTLSFDFKGDATGTSDMTKEVSAHLSWKF